MTDIKKTSGIGQNKPRCQVPIKLAKFKSGDLTLTARIRVNRANRAQQDPRVCNQPAIWEIDGKNYCVSHAGQTALKILTSEGQIDESSKS